MVKHMKLAFGQQLGAIFQIAYVVDDIRAAIHEHARRLHIGPWQLLEHFTPQWQKYRGKPTELDASIAISFSGSMMFELIQQHNDVPSVFRDVVNRRGYGLHHLAVSTRDFEGDCARYRGMGYEPIFEAAAEGGLRVAYFDTLATLPAMLEIMDMPVSIESRWASLQSECAKWDGRDAILESRA
ncbi:MAG TPA: VOC family protein [Steroidobacteraceae bacterium]|nr:VOC family protein [Steroidobacteraceae bacterium]